MNSIRRLFHSEAKGLPRDSMETASTVNKLPKSKKLLPPSDHWTFKQLFSVFFMNGLGAFVISGGINFAVAYGKICVNLAGRCATSMTGPIKQIVRKSFADNLKVFMLMSMLSKAPFAFGDYRIHFLEMRQSQSSSRPSSLG